MSLFKMSALVVVIALAYCFPFIIGSVCLVIVGLYGLYLDYLCIKPSKTPRMTKQNDTKQRLKTYPPTYPNGWYHLTNASDVKSGQVLQVEGIGRKFAVWRSVSGELSVFDAFCPHGGANLCGGSVVGENLQCPFHYWEFAPTGAVTKVPWLEEPPAHIQARKWVFTEFHGMICVWFDAENRPPKYEIPRVAQIESGAWRHCGDWEVDRPINMHLIEYMENTVDIQHFTPMHGEMCIPWTSIKIPGIQVLFDSQAVMGSEAQAAELGPTPSEHFLYFLNTSSLLFCGKAVPRTTASVKVQFIGPATLNRFIFSIPDLGEIVMFQTHLPLLQDDGLALKVRFRWYSCKEIPDALASYVVGEWVSNWWFDVGVWEEKIRRIAPKLVKGDGPIQKGRRWFKQFYSENSEAASSPQSFDW